MGHFHPKNENHLESPQDLLLMINGNERISEFNEFLKRSYEKYISESASDSDKSELKQDLLQKYKDLIYGFVECDEGGCKYWEEWLIWIRGCYAPQILQYIHYIDEYIGNGNNDRFGIIQSEMTFTTDYWIETVQRMRTWIYYQQNGENGYNSFKSFYIENNDTLNKDLNMSELVHVRVGKAAIAVNGDLEFHTRLSRSYKQCNKWLKVLLKEYNDLMISEWRWDLWVSERLK